MKFDKTVEIFTIFTLLLQSWIALSETSMPAPAAEQCHTVPSSAAGTTGQRDDLRKSTEQPGATSPYQNFSRRSSSSLHSNPRLLLKNILSFNQKDATTAIQASTYLPQQSFVQRNDVFCLQALHNRGGSLEAHEQLVEEGEREEEGGGGQQTKWFHSALVDHHGIIDHEYQQVATNAPADNDQQVLYEDEEGEDVVGASLFDTQNDQKGVNVHGDNNENNNLIEAEKQIEPLKLDSPLVYRYYARRRTRTRSSGYVPFIFLSRNVDHCKDTAQELSSRGFSVMACERLPPEDGSDMKTLTIDQSELLIQELLDALRWNKAILVGFDSESVIVMQAALRLAPDRVAGLILCGHLKEAEEMIAEFLEQHVAKRLCANFEVDRFLQHELACPFSVIWDGESCSVNNLPAHQQQHHHHHPEIMLPPESLKKGRYLILGGGSAPHRRRPELVAWSFTRFVEERVLPYEMQNALIVSRPGDIMSRSSNEPSSSVEATSLPAASHVTYTKPNGGVGISVRDLFAPGSFVVTGRVVATVIFYFAMTKIFVHQYYNFHDGLVTFNSKLELLVDLPRRGVNLLSAIMTSLGSMFALMKQRTKRERLTTNNKIEVEQSESDIASTKLDNATGDNDDEDEGKASDQEELKQKKTPTPQKPRPIFFLDHVVA